MCRFGAEVYSFAECRRKGRRLENPSMGHAGGVCQCFAGIPVSGTYGPMFGDATKHAAVCEGRNVC